MSDPWMKFYPRDWRGDQALRAVSVAARGLWIDCLCIMHEAKPYGHLVLNGASVDGGTLARMTGIQVDEVTALMAELRQAGVLSVTSRGVVFSRRMTKDHARAQKGRKAANKRWSQASDDVEQSEAPNGSASGSPTTQKPEARHQKEIEPIAQHTEPASAALPRDWLDQLLVANGMNTGFREERHIGLINPAPLIGLLEAGFDWRRDIVAGVASKPNPKVRTWGYFEGQIRDFAAKRDGIASRPAPADHETKLASWPIERWRLVVEQYRQTNEWQRQTYGPRPGEPGCLVPSELLSRAAA